MTLPDLLSACRLAGVELFLEGGAVRYRAPAGVLTAELRQALKARKAELSAALAAPPGWDAARAAAVPAECDRIIDAGLPGLTPAQRNVAEVYRGLVRRYADGRDALLWAMPDFLRGELARWRARRPAGF
jgi:hypothetical protein